MDGARPGDRGGDRKRSARRQKGDEGAGRDSTIHGPCASVPGSVGSSVRFGESYWLVTGRSGGRTARPTLLVSVPNQTVFVSGS